MGLAGRKTKQRINADPRNLSWADDASRFGSSYLAKLGWDSSQGLGVSGEGRTSHLKVTQKLDMLGIGAAQQRDPNGIAWKQNKDFESVLARLNATVGEKTQAEEDEDGVGKEEADVEVEESTKKKEKKKKRKAEDGEDEKKEKKRKKSKMSEEDKEEAAPIPVEEEPKKPYVPRVKAHRARNIASKNLASKSAAAIAEILGVSSSSTTPSSTSAQTSGTLTPLTDDIEPLEKLTTSTKSVADYFKERLAAKSGNSTPTSTPDNETDIPRGGLGSSRLRFGVTTEENESGESMFASLKSSSFLAATMQITTPVTEEVSEANVTHEKVEKKSKKKEEKATEEEGLNKEERKRLKAQRKAEKAKRKAEKVRRKQEAESSS